GEQLIGKYNVFEDEIAIEQGLIPKIRTVFEDGKTANFSVEWDANELGYKDAKKVHIEGTMFPIHDDKGELTNVVNHWIDITKRNEAMTKLVSKTSELTKEITERIQTEEKLIESEKKHRTLFETMVQGVVYQDADGEIISANPAAERILGLTLSQMQGRVSTDPRWKAIHEDGSDFPGKTHPAMVSLKTGQPVHDVVMGVFHPDKERTCWIRINSIPTIRPGEKNPHQVYTTFTDITKHRRLEAQLQQSQKMESIGTLAGGIAHDFNNILFPIIGHSEMLIEDTPEESPFLNDLKQIYTSALRASDLVKQILTFSRQENGELKLVKMQPIIKEALKLIRSSIPTTIKIKQNISSNCGIIKA
ncbi:MAG: PAS domain S-box protein, partial [Desulfobacula sp.]|nr:PAS domain S-box protein [Desulfobacula sp.]